MALTDRQVKKIVKDQESQKYGVIYSRVFAYGHINYPAHGVIKIYDGCETPLHKVEAIVYNGRIFRVCEKDDAVDKG